MVREVRKFDFEPDKDIIVGDNGFVIDHIPASRWALTAFLIGLLGPREALAVEPPSCGNEDTWPDISGFYEVTGTCGDHYCPQVIERVRDEGAYCRFDIEDGDPSCSLVDDHHEPSALGERRRRRRRGRLRLHDRAALEPAALAGPAAAATSTTW